MSLAILETENTKPLKRLKSNANVSDFH